MTEKTYKITHVRELDGKGGVYMLEVHSTDSTIGLARGTLEQLAKSIIDNDGLLLSRCDTITTIEAPEIKGDHNAFPVENDELVEFHRYFEMYSNQARPKLGPKLDFMG